MGERERKTENKISDKLPVRLFLTTRSHERVTALPRCLFLTQSVSSICNVHYHYYIRRVTNWTNSVSTPSNFLALCCFLLTSDDFISFIDMTTWVDPCCRKTMTWNRTTSIATNSAEVVHCVVPAIWIRLRPLLSHRNLGVVFQRDSGNK
jgi:hypothetical protein